MNEEKQTIDFVHPRLEETVTAIGGNYMFNKEVRLPYNGREVLYFAGVAVFDTTCCGSGGCGYAIVPGYIHRYQSGKNEKGLPVSCVEPITSRKSQEEIRKLVMKREMVHQVRFD